MNGTADLLSPPYAPVAPLIAGLAGAACRACVTIPARDEETTLPACLDALAGQVDLGGRTLSRRSFEVLLLLNNCKDGSSAVARAWQYAHPDIALHVAECTLSPELAHAGTARKLLLDTAWQRLAGLRFAPSALLCTDADSVVAPDWIAQNLLALERGADAVGGQIELGDRELDQLPEPVRSCYERDRQYGRLIAHLEALLDPQAGDPWPRHQHHFGSSLACTPQAYAAAGGMPEVPTLEDEAFVHQLRRAGLRLRHEPAVKVYTSARLQGRAKVGLASQLLTWGKLRNAAAHCVQSAAFLAHRFTSLRSLRAAYAARSLGSITFPTGEWRNWALVSLQRANTLVDFLAAIDSDGLIEATFTGQREESIAEAIRALQAGIAAYGD